MNNQQPDYKRLLLTVFLAAIVLTGWQALIEWPRRQKLAHYAVEQVKIRNDIQEKQAEARPVKDADSEEAALTYEQKLAEPTRVAIRSDTLHGSIDLKGARFDDLTLAKYKESLSADSEDVLLFSPGGDENAYFAQAGWVSSDGKTKVPDQHTLWHANSKTLAPGTPVKLNWDNGEGVTFTLSVALDDAYMFTIGQQVSNHSGHEVSVEPYAYINRTYDEKAIEEAIKELKKHQRTVTSVVHTGPLGVMNGSLEQVGYKELHDKGNKTYDDASGWFGITDQYWLSALIPGDAHYKTTFSHYVKNGSERYQVDYLGQAHSVAAGAAADDSIRLFAGVKELKILDHYTKGDKAQGVPPIPLFDRAVDFGMLYFLTKPLLIMLTFFYGLAGNFGIAIMMMTLVVRACLYPLANKSFKATAQMRNLQPQMMKIREQHADDSIALNKGMLELYKREKVNPASGCLPVLVQMPVFFSLYKVLYVSIEMRHAPFFGWIHDLSVADPSNIFTLFGLVNWPVPAFLHLGILPMAMCVTMILQMKQQPKPADPMQAKMMNFMPYFFLFIFAKMPAGLVLYWTWSNTISILQQRLISTRHKTVDEQKLVKAR
jgi:YidC/Oxa1 family membrane protein insertase